MDQTFVFDFFKFLKFKCSLRKLLTGKHYGNLRLIYINAITKDQSIDMIGDTVLIQSIGPSSNFDRTRILNLANLSRYLRK